MDALVVHTAARQHADVVDCPGTVLRVRLRALNQQIGCMLVLLPAFQHKINVRIGVTDSQIFGKLRAPFQLLHAVAHSNVATPAVNQLIEKFQSTRVMNDRAFEQLFRLILGGECAHALHILIR